MIRGLIPPHPVWVLLGLILLAGSGVLLMFALLGWAVMPEHHVDTAELEEHAPAIFLLTTDVPYPENAIIARVAWADAGPDAPVLHLILDASRMDLGDWIKTVRPFGIPLERVTPERSIEWNAIGLDCGEDGTEIDRAEKPTHQLVNLACEFMANPHEVWTAQKRDHMDRMRTIIVDEDAKMIWLQGS